MNSIQVTEPCCACEEAKYEVTFEGLWSEMTHPRQFPSSKWLLHFSDIIGASHSADYRYCGSIVMVLFENRNKV